MGETRRDEMSRSAPELRTFGGAKSVVAGQTVLRPFPIPSPSLQEPGYPGLPPLLLSSLSLELNIDFLHLGNNLPSR